MDVTEWAAGRENLVSPEEADRMIAIMADRPDLFKILREWEPCGSSVTVIRRDDGTALFGYGMLHPWLSE